MRQSEKSIGIGRNETVRQRRELLIGQAAAVNSVPGWRKRVSSLPAFEKRNSCTFGRLASPKEERQNPEDALFWAGTKLRWFKKLCPCSNREHGFYRILSDGWQG